MTISSQNGRVGSDLPVAGLNIPTWALLLMSGLLLGLAYPPNPVGLLGSIGLVPLLYALERGRSYREMIRWAYLSLLLFSALSTWWVGSWQAKTEPFLMMSCVLLVLIHPLFFLVPLIAYRAVRRATTPLFALAFLPFLWTGGEYLHALTDASYPWLTLGNTQTYNLYYIQFIEYTGVWGLSFLLMVQNCAFTAMLFSLGSERKEQARIIRGSIVLIAVTLVVPYAHGLFVLDGEEETGRNLTVTIIQPNMDPWEKWKQNDTVNHIVMHGDLSRATIGSTKPDMFLWAETAIPNPLTQPGAEHRMAEMRAVVDGLGVPVMSGFPDYMRYARKEDASPSSKTGLESDGRGGADTFYYDHFNSVGMFVPGRGLTGAYHKMQLVPFGERIPFADDLPFLIEMLTWDMGISAWGKGKNISVFDVPYDGTTTRGAAVICFESVYPNVTRKFVEAGAEFLTIVTNDGWYMGTPGPLQHERIAIMRAIENRRGIARAANTGISCFITPYGRIISETEENERTSLTDKVELRDDLTLYTRWGDWFPGLCLAAAAVMGGIAAYRGFRRRS